MQKNQSKENGKEIRCVCTYVLTCQYAFTANRALPVKQANKGRKKTLLLLSHHFLFFALFSLVYNIKFAICKKKIDELKKEKPVTAATKTTAAKAQAITYYTHKYTHKT